MKAKKHYLGRPAVTTLLLTLIRLYSGTFRYRWQGLPAFFGHLEAGEKVVICHWHQQFFPAIARYGGLFRKYKPALMISQSADGEMIAKVAERVGWHIRRGSSTRGGIAAMKEMVDHVRAYGFGAHILDGPTGPIGVVKAGAVRIAQLSDASLVPVRVEADRYWLVGSWDRFLIPKPFAKVTFTFGTPIPAPSPDADEKAFAAVRKAVETEMADWLY